MSVTGNPYDKKMGVIKVRLTSLPQLHPFSLANNAAQNYYCLALDTKGFQVEIDLQAMPPGVTLAQLQPNQVWWVEKRTTLYRLYLYGGIFDSTKNQVVSTAPLPSSAATGGVPAGTLLDFAGPVAPSGYLLCDGSSYSTTTYSGLFNAISYTWGGTGSSFNVPDLRGRVTIGAGSGTGLTFRALATYSGEETHVLVSGETPLVAHSHGFSVPAQTGLTTSTGTSNTVSLNTAGGSTGSGSTGTGTTNSTTTVAGSASISSGNTATGNASISASASQSAHSHTVTPTAGPFWEVSTNGTGAYRIGTAAVTGGVSSARISSETTDSQTPSITVSASDSGHSHSLSGVSVSIPSLTVNGATIPALSIPSLSIASQAVTGSVSIPGLAFTVPAQTGLTTSGNTATTASGHNNMQPYAVVTKIIKY
jgi:hypothetical protein